MLNACASSGNQRSLLAIAFSVALLFFLGDDTVHAFEGSPPDYSEETLTGGWGGKRAEWYEQGVAIDSAYKVDLMRNEGGLSDGEAAMGNADFMLRADLERLWDWKSAVAYLQVINGHGGQLNADHVGSLMGTSNVEVPFDTTRVFHAWLQKGFFDDQLSALLGLYPVDSEFSIMESAAEFVHPALGPSADFAMTRGPSIYNNSAFGLRLRWDSEDRAFYALGALLDGMPGDPDDPHGTHIIFDSEDGIFAIAEFGFLPEERGHAFEPTDPTKPVLQGAEIREHEKLESFGKYAIGFWSYSSKVEDLMDTDASGNLLKHRNWGGYLLAEKTLYRERETAENHLAGFFRVSGTDGNSTPILYTINTGLRYRGPFRGRSNDIAGFVYTYARLSHKFREAHDLAGFLTTASEQSVELTYRFQAAKWFAVQPVWQYIRHPGGDAAIDSAQVIGVRLDVAL